MSEETSCQVKWALGSLLMVGLWGGLGYFIGKETSSASSGPRKARR